MKLSVIIPVGDREKHLRCRASIERSIAADRQHAGAWELVEVFDDEHRGVAWARNEGVKRAKGEWIAWADCDDEVRVEWASSISGAVESISENVDLIAFGARVEWDDGREGYDISYERGGGIVSAEIFAMDVMSAGRMGSWFWTKVFRRSVFEGRTFVGRAFEDYRILCEMVPSLRAIEYLPRSLYIYHRSSSGLSQFVDRDASLSALVELAGIAESRSDQYRDAMCRGVAVQAADFCRHAGSDPMLRLFIRRHIMNLILSSDVAFRIKVKCLLAALL